MTIYIIQVGKDGPVKIGHTAKNFRKRIYGIQVSHHATLILRGLLDGGPRKERELHEQFGEDHIRGEWFAPSKALKEFIETLVPPPPPPPRRGNPNRKLSPEEAKAMGRLGGMGKLASMRAQRMPEELARPIWQTSGLTEAERLKLLNPPGYFAGKWTAASAYRHLGRKQ